MTEGTGSADASRRTRLAAERTWLAWWRTGIAASAAAVAVGTVVPQLVESARWPFVALGVGYACVATAVFLVGERRRQRVDAALKEGRFEQPDPRAAAALTAAGVLLALATLGAILVAA